jgi:flagellar biogenesis protein FliO
MVNTTIHEMSSLEPFRRASVAAIATGSVVAALMLAGMGIWIYRRFVLKKKPGRKRRMGEAAGSVEMK